MFRSFILQILLIGVTDTILVNSEETITLGKTRTVINLAYTSLTTALLQTESSRTGVCNDITSNGLLRIRIEHSTGSTINLGNNLVGNNNSNTELVCKALQGSHELGQMRLP